MATATYLASMVVTGLLAVVLFALVARGRDWRRYQPQAVGAGTGGGTGRREGSARLVVVFVLLVLVATGGTLVILGDSGSNMLTLVGAGAGIVGFLVLGSYSWARSRGYPHSHAVATALVILGLVIVLAMAGNLITQFGA